MCSRLLLLSIVHFVFSLLKWNSYLMDCSELTSRKKFMLYACIDRTRMISQWRKYKLMPCRFLVSKSYSISTKFHEKCAKSSLIPWICDLFTNRLLFSIDNLTFSKIFFGCCFFIVIAAASAVDVVVAIIPIY